jgi:putative ABC transport system permease protein
MAMASTVSGSKACPLAYGIASRNRIVADMLKSLGLVWIPGVMAGMVVSGASPVYAGIYQFVIIAMILAASGITGMLAILLMRRRAFSPAAQLVLRREESSQPVSPKI